MKCSSLLVLIPFAVAMHACGGDMAPDPSFTRAPMFASPSADANTPADHGGPGHGGGQGGGDGQGHGDGQGQGDGQGHGDGQGQGGGGGGTGRLPQPACILVVPDNPLTARGLATPYQLLAPCQEANNNVNAFVQATIFDPATGNLSVYNPLVINANSTPLIPPQLPTVPANAVVGIWFGFNGTTLVLQGNSQRTLGDSNCINGLGTSYFGQVAACNAVAFFEATKAAIRDGLTKAPPLGTALDGGQCPTTRDFSVVDVDPSDNVTATYLAAANGRTAQNTPENVAALNANKVSFAVVANGSDNALLAVHIDPALGCSPWTAPDITSPSASITNTASYAPAQALNELHAHVWQSCLSEPPGNVALVEAADEMVLVNGKPSPEKLALYRAIVGQPPTGMADSNFWCNKLATIGAPRLMNAKSYLAAAATLDPAMGTNLFTFLVARLQGTMGTAGNGLGCAKLGSPFPFKVTVNAQGVITDATLPTPPPQASGER